MKDNDDINDESRRFRSPSFRKIEIETLIDLIAKYKSVVLNKSTTSAASHLKEAAWANIASVYNRQGFEHFRTPNMLKHKWENLKRNINKNLGNNFQDKNYDYSHITEQVVSLVSESNDLRDSNPTNIPQDILEGFNEKNPTVNTNTNKSCTNDYLESLDEPVSKSEDEDFNEFRNSDGKPNRVRSANFSPEECSLLLRCVRSEKEAIFNKKTDSLSNARKLHAWKRVTKNYNRLTPKKRTGTVLVRKFWNLRKTAKKMGLVIGKKNKFKEDFSDEMPFKSIKKEPSGELEDMGYLMEDDPTMIVELSNDNNTIGSNHCETPDPLTFVGNRESGIESGSSSTSSNELENTDTVKLKLEILNYKLETAKIERRRLEELMKSETAERELRAKEMALRLRAARLDAVAAELKLPSNHPALHYTSEELPAKNCLQK